MLYQICGWYGCRLCVWEDGGEQMLEVWPPDAAGSLFLSRCHYLYIDKVPMISLASGKRAKWMSVCRKDGHVINDCEQTEGPREDYIEYVTWLDESLRGNRAEQKVISDVWEWRLQTTSGDFRLNTETLLPPLLLVSSKCVREVFNTQLLPRCTKVQQPGPFFAICKAIYIHVVHTSL